MKNASALLDKMENHGLHLHPILEEQREEVFKSAGRFDDRIATHFLMRDNEVLWLGQLSHFEKWLNSHFR
jgi:hypothetical protein